MKWRNFKIYVGLALFAFVVLLFVDAYVNDLLRTATLDSNMRALLSIVNLVLSPFGVAMSILIGVALTRVAWLRRNA